LSTAYQINEGNKIRDNLELKTVGVASEAKMHTPTITTEQAVEVASNLKADCVIAIGGGNATGLGEAISIRTGLFHIYIPTTYAGSEKNLILGETANGLKTTSNDCKILPGTVSQRMFKTHICCFAAANGQ
jgi:alcohol dehydrogenase class IV